MVSESHRDRAQLILVAALVMAFMLVALVLVFNTVIYTNTMSTAESQQMTSEGELVQHELEAGTVDLITHVNGNGFYDFVEMYDETEAAVEKYDMAVSNTATHSRSGSLSFELKRVYDRDRGMILKQNNDAREFTNDSESEDWIMLNNRDNPEEAVRHGAHFQRFDVTLNFAESENETDVQEAFRFVVLNDTGPHHYVITWDGGQNQVTIQYFEFDPNNPWTPTGSPSRVCSFDNVSDQMTVDFLSGSTSEGSCDVTIPLTEADPTFGYGLEIRNGDKMAGTYEIWTSNDNANCIIPMAGDPECVEGPSFNEVTSPPPDPIDDQPYIKWFMWEPVIEVTHVSEDVIQQYEVRVSVGDVPYEVDDS